MTCSGNKTQYSESVGPVFATLRLVRVLWPSNEVHRSSRTCRAIDRDREFRRTSPDRRSLFTNLLNVRVSLKIQYIVLLSCDVMMVNDGWRKAPALDYMTIIHLINVIACLFRRKRAVINIVIFTQLISGVSNCGATQAYFAIRYFLPTI